MVIGDLPIGSVVRLGRYCFPHNSDGMFNIDWIKVSKQNDFISQKVLLGMQFDAYEGWSTNSNYLLSNIRQFMNSEDHSWYHPTHPDDCGPGYLMLESYIRTPIHRYSGLLSHFSDEEMMLLEIRGADYMRLPKASEVDGGFPYFKRYGKRAHPVYEYGIIERDCYREGMYSRYYLLGDNPGSLYEMDRSGSIQPISPATYSGVRPVCNIKANAEVVQTGKNTYEIKILSSTPVRFFKETQSLDWLLGI